jgi:CubicO group peptidase (beta-lactamase class C family)
VTDEALADWVHSRMQAALEAKEFVGATVAITSGDGLVFSHGYGYASLADGLHADSARTAFRSGSSNKVMTSLLALQMASEGILDLDAAISECLTRIDPPQPFGPVTVRDLLTHAGGFEERFQGTLTDRELPEIAPAETIKRLWCKQIRPAGQAVQYSNFAFALLGTVLEDVSGLSYRELLTERILEPLKMRATGVELTGHLPDRCANEHWFQADGSVRETGHLLKTPFYLPAGGLFFTAEDVAAFVAAALRVEPALMSKDIASQMTQPRWSIPGGGARGLGWWLSRVGDDVLFRHGGSTESFDMTMLGIPSVDRGIVIMRTGDWDWRLTAGVRSTFGRWNPPVNALDTYTEALQFAAVATGATVHAMPATAKAGVTFTAGTYLPTRRAFSTSERLTDLAQSPAQSVRKTSGVSIRGVKVDLSDGCWVSPDESQVYEPVPGRPARFIRMGSALFENRPWFDRRPWALGSIVAPPPAAAMWLTASDTWSASAAVAVTIAAVVAVLVLVQIFWPPVHWRLWSPMTLVIACATAGLVGAILWTILAGQWPCSLLLLPELASLLRNRAHRPG